ncbi:MAG: energy transducer TonB [Nitrospiraceae bacterium]|nr:energy transducer TonB [Nitrospiraceae bacterium]
MKLPTGKRLGQSGGELAAAVSFSLAFHVIVLSAGLLLSYLIKPRVYIPPFYQVKLVDLPAETPLLPPSMTAPPAAAPAAPAPKKPAPPKPAKAPKAAKAAPAPKPATVSKQAMPELKTEQKKEKPVEEAAPQPRPAEAAGKKQAVAVSASTSEFSFPPYVAIVRDKVERNWNPPPGAKGATVTVVFQVLRSGRVGDAKLTRASGNFYFDQAAMRAIFASSPFPPLPEGFFRDSETFSVDLMEKD